MRLGMFKNPVLRFGEGTASSPYEGFKMGLKPFKRVPKICMEVVYRRDYRREARNLVLNLVNGVKGYRGFSEFFGTEVEYWYTPVDSSESYLDAVSKAQGDVVIILIPDEMSVEYDEDPYMPLKRSLSMRGIPSQMIEYSTARYLSNKGYVLFNIALNIFSKAGGIPWMLAEPPSSSLTIGIDSGGGGVALTVFNPESEKVFEWHTGFSPGVEVIDLLKKPMLEMLAEIDNIEDAETIIFHRDGFAHPFERDSIRDVVDTLKLEGILRRDVYWALIEIRKRSVPRLLRNTSRGYRNPIQGAYLQLDPYKYVVATVGFPDHPLLSDYGISRPLVVEVVETSNWDRDPKPFIRDVYWLAQLNWASGLLPTKLPITTLYAHRIVSFWRAGVNPSINLKSKLWFL